jgi:hypothetical protein
MDKSSKQGKSLTFPVLTAYGLVAGFWSSVRRPRDTDPIAEPNTGD